MASTFTTETTADDLVAGDQLASGSGATSWPVAGARTVGPIVLVELPHGTVCLRPTTTVTVERDLATMPLPHLATLAEETLAAAEATEHGTDEWEGAWDWHLHVAGTYDQRTGR